jgi:type VI secretion system VasD/TssJ family lipoprotein
MKCRLLFLCIVLCAACLSGCSKPSIDLVVASQPNVNPDYSGRPSPVIIKMYELRRDIAFRQADFQTLFEKPMQALGADLIAADELVFTPGEVRRVAYQPWAHTRFMGLVAGFRHMERAQWRATRRIDPEARNIIAVELNDATILLIPENEAKSWKPEEAIRTYQQSRVTTVPQTGQQAPLEQPSSASVHRNLSGDTFSTDSEWETDPTGWEIPKRKRPPQPLPHSTPSADTRITPQPYSPQIPPMRPIP